MSSYNICFNALGSLSMVLGLVQYILFELPLVLDQLVIYEPLV